MQLYAILYKRTEMIKKILLCLLLLSSTACQEKKNDDILKVAISPDYPPFEYKKDGKIVGYDVDMAQLVAKRLNKKLEINEMEFSSLIPALQSGKVDFIVSGITITPEREANIDFSEVYYRASIVGLSFLKQNIHSAEDLKGKKIGAQLGSVMELFAKNEQKKFEDIKIVSLGNNLHLLEELKLGRIDILFLEEGQVKEFLKGNPELVSVTFPETGSGYAIGLKKGSNLTVKFNQVLNELKDSGDLKALEKIWLK